MLETRNLSKKFGDNVVLKDINLQIGDGEVYGLIGANGSGKSTFLNILNGNEVIEKTGGYTGSIRIDGRDVAIHTHSQSLEFGIAMVHQELALFRGMSVTENIKINRENTKGRVLGIPEFTLVDEKKNREDAAKTLEWVGTDLDPDQNIDHLALNQKQFVEIARELDNQQIRLLMLDEPTSSLNITETRELLKCIREIAASGISVLFISHRLDEIMEVCDRVSVLWDGELISTYHKEEYSVDRFVSDMIGQEVVKAQRKEKREAGPIWFCYEDSEGNRKLEIREGEILGITGLAGQGQEQFTDGLFGLRPSDLRVICDGEAIRCGDSKSLVERGVYYLSDDRAGTSLLMDSPIWKNMIFGTEKNHPEFLRFPKMPAFSFLNEKRVREYTNEMIETLNIVCKGADQPVRELSGGNQQKVCVGRALTFRPKLLFVSEPTRGIDVYSKELILQWLLRINQEYGTAVVVVSGETEELLRVCDRIAVMYQDDVFRTFEGDIDPEEMTLALYGRMKDEA